MMNNEDAPTVDEFYKANPELKKQMDNILSDTDDLLNLANAKLNFNASTNRMGKAESLDDYAIEAIISFVNGSAVISQ